jgi:hypothetical protein
MAEHAKQHPMFAGDCPRCGQSRTTFDILAATYVRDSDGQSGFESFLRCRSCYRPSIGLLRETGGTQDSPLDLNGQYANSVYSLEEWVFEIPNRRACPPHVPDDVKRIFDEAAICTAIGTWDAGGTMFRKVLDVATRSITRTPDALEEPRPASWKVYKDLRLRLDWLFDNQLLSPALKELSSCIHEDGNDAAHDVQGIDKPEAEDLADFCEQILQVLYSVPGQIDENRRRRNKRRGIDGSSEEAPAGAA